MKIHFRFFLSHDNFEKYQYFMNKACILRNFRAKIALKRRALRDVIMLLLITSLEKTRETGVKSVMLRVSYWKIYEMALCKGDSCDKIKDAFVIHHRWQVSLGLAINKTPIRHCDNTLLCFDGDKQNVFVEHWCPRQHQSSKCGKIWKSCILTPSYLQGYVMSMKH